MHVIEGKSGVIYFKEINNSGTYEAVNAETTPAGVKLYSLERTLLNENGEAEEYFYLIPKTITSDNIIAKQAEVTSGNILNGITASSGRSATININGTDLVISFPLVPNPADPTVDGDGYDTIIKTINDEVVKVLGDDYENFATRHPDSNGQQISQATDTKLAK
jgi:hypothetical protein